MCKKTVTAVLPARNCRRELKRCLQALAAGGSVPEIIVVDDGSKDGTAQMVRRYLPDATVLTLRAHTGYAHAANAGLRLVRTEYALLLRPDLQPSRHCVDRLLEAVSGEPAGPGGSVIFCAVPQAVMYSEAFQNTDPRKNSFQYSGPSFSVPTLAVPDGCAMYRMDVLERIGWLDERHYDGLEALDLSMRAALYGYDTVRAEGAYVRPADRSGQERDQAREALRRRLAPGNGLFTFYKNLPGLYRLPALPLEAAVQRTQAAIFAHRDGKEDYRMAVGRGRMLCALERERREAFEEGASNYPENLSGASYLAMGEEAGRICPLFLAYREPASPDRIPRYLRIYRQLLRDHVRLIRILAKCEGFSVY